ncbi:MAG: hypothetical protein JWR19_2178 [Pedosphaera sp.]|nr:hypothetical protein [Pedosphaera sp.]
MKTITVEIDANGQVTIEAAGFKGNACEKATEALEKALGVPSNRKKKPEYYTEDKTQITTGN